MNRVMKINKYEYKPVDYLYGADNIDVCIESIMNCFNCSLDEIEFFDSMSVGDKKVGNIFTVSGEYVGVLNILTEYYYIVKVITDINIMKLLSHKLTFDESVNLKPFIVKLIELADYGDYESLVVVSPSEKYAKFMAELVDNVFLNNCDVVEIDCTKPGLILENYTSV